MLVKVRDLILILRQNHRIGGRIADSWLLNVGKEGRETVEVFLCEGIKFVVVAFGTTHRSSQKNLRGVTNSIRCILGDVLFGLSTTFTGCLQQHVETRGDLLLESGFGQKISGQLLNDKLIIRHVVVEGLDDVIPIRCNLARFVRVVAIAVRISNDIKPIGRHAFAEVGRSQ